VLGAPELIYHVAYVYVIIDHPVDEPIANNMAARLLEESHRRSASAAEMYRQRDKHSSPHLSAYAKR
jgi:hypothetical protein